MYDGCDHKENSKLHYMKDKVNMPCGKVENKLLISPEVLSSSNSDLLRSPTATSIKWKKQSDQAIA